MNKQSMNMNTRTSIYNQLTINEYEQYRSCACIEMEVNFRQGYGSIISLHSVQDGVLWMVQAEDNAFVVFLANVDISAKMSYILFSMFRDLFNEIKMILATVLKNIDLYPFAHFLVFCRVFVIFCSTFCFKD
jgi:hypothetical protein